MTVVYEAKLSPDMIWLAIMLISFMLSVGFSGLGWGFGVPQVCVVATELALVQCFAIRFLTNPKTIMQSQQTSVINRDSDPPGGRTSPQSDHHGSEGGHQGWSQPISGF